tara:strand:- start:601 stop:1773 length:1173 start_codon:yes stop_codon:yes gene_type:complete
MKFVLAIYGRFFFFDFAKSLNKKKQLICMITSYPKFVTSRWNLPKNIIISFPIFEILRRLIQLINFQYEYLNIGLKKIFSYFIILSLPKELKIYGFFAGNGFNSEIIKKLKTRGVICIAFEGSAHILYKYKLLSDEYKDLNVAFEMHKQKKLISETLKEYDYADYIHVPSKFVKDTFISQGVNTKKLIHIPYAVDYNFFKPLIVKKKDNFFKVLFVGGISFRKGAHYLLDAANLLKEINIQFIFVGNISPDFKKYLKLKKFDKTKVLFKGHKKREDLPYYYSSADVFCLPSLEEGLAAAQIEAMACSLPIICTTNTGGADLIINNNEGFVIPVKDSVAIKNKILYLFNNRDMCLKMGKKAYEKTNNFFSWDSFVDKLNNKLNHVFYNRNN